MLRLSAPPPTRDVPPVTKRTNGEKPRTMREQRAEHPSNPACASCHKIMDSIGFALENYDAVGAWRNREAGVAVDASGDLADGTHVDGVVQLRAALIKNPDLFVGTLTEKMLTYALGRGVDYRDMPTVRAIVRDASRNGNKFSSIVMGIVRSTPFQMRLSAPREDTSDNVHQ